MSKKKIGRNEPCPCRSGKKYKQCCLNRDIEFIGDGSEPKSTPVKKSLQDEQSLSFDELTKVRLFRFRSFAERELVALKTNQIWFGSIDSFNDPFEFSCASPFNPSGLNASKLKGEFRDSAKELGIDPSLVDSETCDLAVKSILQTLQNTLFESMGVACFSRSLSNPLLWAHYADGHRGFCIGYDRTAELLSLVTDVVYQDNLPTARVGDIVGLRKGPDSHLMRLIHSILTTKPTAWSHEQELRLFVPKQGLQQISSQATTEVFFGWKINKADRAKMIDQLSGHNIEFFDMVPLERTFGVTPRSIEFA